jgi:hypothetical protein
MKLEPNHQGQFNPVAEFFLRDTNPHADTAYYSLQKNS